MKTNFTILDCFGLGRINACDIGALLSLTAKIKSGAHRSYMALQIIGLYFISSDLRLSEWDYFSILGRSCVSDGIGHFYFIYLNLAFKCRQFQHWNPHSIRLSNLHKLPTLRSIWNSLFGLSLATPVSNHFFFERLLLNFTHKRHWIKHFWNLVTLN